MLLKYRYQAVEGEEPAWSIINVGESVDYRRAVFEIAKHCYSDENQGDFFYEPA